MNRKKIITLSIVSILIISTIAILYNTYYKSKVYENNKAEKNIYNNMISIYLEKSYDSGQYELSTSSKWPTGYQFNKSLSYCEGGSSLSWDDSDNSVSVNTRITDKCYVYFDKYLSANLNSVSTEDTLTNSFTMVISATPGKNEIVKYLYSLDDGQTYTETTDNIVSVTGLTKNTLYRLKVYAVDSEGIKSNILSTSVQTPDKVVLADFIKSKYTGIQGQNSLYYHDNTLTNGAGDNSYRYSGADFVLTDKAKNAGYKSVIASSSTDRTKTDLIYFSCRDANYLGDLCDTNESTPEYRLRYDSTRTIYSTFGAALDKAVEDGYITKDNVKNFVCFGSTADTCPEMNLYRIIGVFGDQIKLIKYDYSNRTDIGTGGEYYGFSSSFRSGSRNNPERHYSYYWNYKTNKKAQKKHTIVQGFILMAMLFVGIITQNIYYFYLCLLPLLSFFIIWASLLLNVRRISKKVFLNKELTLEIFPDKILICRGKIEQEIALDGSCDYEEYDNLITISSFSGTGVVIPIRAIEPEFRAEVQAMILAGAKPIDG